MDELIARVVAKLMKAGYWDNTLFVFSSDNGGCATGFSAGCAGGSSNFPFRGSKSTLYEGGVRGTAFFHSPSPNVIPESARGGSAQGLAHIVDIFPTLLGLVSRALKVCAGLHALVDVSAFLHPVCCK